MSIYAADRRKLLSALKKRVEKSSVENEFQVKGQSTNILEHSKMIQFHGLLFVDNHCVSPKPMIWLEHQFQMVINSLGILTLITE